jgi:hypothetical protein
MLTAEQIQENYDKFYAFCEKHTGDRSENILKLVDSLGVRLATCPASTKISHHCAYPGGLIEHCLHVLGNAMILNKSFGWNLKKESIVVAALFHDLGKCSHLIDDNETDDSLVDYYIPQDSNWHKEKLGENYKHNDLIPYMTVPHRGIWMLQRYGVKLSYDEQLAILLHDGFVLQENKAYCLKEPILAHVIMTADYISTMQEKTKNDVAANI